MNPIRKLSVVHFAAAALSLAMALPAGAGYFVSDVMLIGHDTSSGIESLKSTYQSQGWTVITKDLNAGAGGDYIHLLYKTAYASTSRTGGARTTPIRSTARPIPSCPTTAASISRTCTAT